jgi:protein phosphatase
MADPTALTAAWRTDTGLVRGHNEDFVIAYEPPTDDDRRRHGAVYIVADGVGGADAGEVASQYASERTLHHYLAGDGRTDWGARLLDAMQAANTDLRRLAAERDDSRRMATTMVAAVIQDGHAYIGNVGDSRAYQYRAGQLEQISRDQSLVARLVEEGALTPEEAATYPYKNVILTSIGSEKRPPIDLYEIELEPGDLLVLCSDGLTRHVEDGEIGVIAGDEPPEVAADILLRLARERGGEDNITVAIIQHGPRTDAHRQAQSHRAGRGHNPAHRRAAARGHAAAGRRPSPRGRTAAQPLAADLRPGGRHGRAHPVALVRSPASDDDLAARFQRKGAKTQRREEAHAKSAKCAKNAKRILLASFASSASLA